MKESKLLEKKGKLKEDIERRNKLRGGEFHKKLAKLDEIDLLEGDFETMDDYLTTKLIETRQELESLRKQKE